MIQIWLDIVQRYPVLTGVTAASSNFIAWLYAVIKTSLPILQFTSLSIGILVGLLTLYGLIKKHFPKK